MPQNCWGYNMICNEKMYALGAKRSVIRELFEYGKKRKAVVDAVAAVMILESYLTYRRHQTAKEIPAT